MNQQLILVIDGDPGGLGDTRASLESLGFLVLAVPDPVGARRCLETIRPNAILVALPGPDGAALELARGLKSDPLTSGLPLVAVTGPAQPPAGPAALQAGFDTSISRPFDPARLRDILEARAPGAAN